MLNHPLIFPAKINILVMLSLLIGSITFPSPAYAASVITVDTNADTIALDGVCSLREAIINANNDAQTNNNCVGGTGNDTILFSDALGTATILLTSTLPNITDTDSLTINGGSDITLSGNDLYRILIIDTSKPLILDNLTLTNANTGGLGTGGAIYNAGTLTVTNSIFSNNDGGIGGAIANTGGFSTLDISNSIFTGNTAAQLGGAIYSEILTTITNSTFSNNTATSLASGGGIYVSNGTLTVTNSSFIGNSAGQNGGGVASQATTTIINSTFSGNTATLLGGGFLGNSGTHTLINNTFSGNSGGTGSGIYNSGTLNLTNTILANSIAGVDCYNSSGNTIATNTKNLIKTNGASGHMCGTPTLTSDPALNALADNGGSTQTFALQSSSPALGAGTNTGCPSTDQRGVTRPQNGICDIGAYELNAQPGPALVVNTNEDSDDGFCDSYVAGVTDCTLREAINYANSTAVIWTITFAANYTITLSSQLPAVTGTIIINGNGAANTIIEASSVINIATYRVFQVGASGDLTLVQNQETF